METANFDSLCISQFKKVVVNSGGRWTKEREFLLQIIGKLKNHFLAEDILQGMHAQGFNIALTTVYRNISLLLEAKIIRRASIYDDINGGIKYEFIWGQNHHDHLLCSKCDTKIEFSYPAIDILQEAVAKDYGFILENHHLELVGICSQCQEKNVPTQLALVAEYKLTSMALNKTVKILKFLGDKQNFQRLNALGIQINDQIKVIRRGPFNGPLLIEILSSDGKLMIDRKLAQDIMVVEI